MTNKNVRIEAKPKLSLVPANFMYNSSNRLRNYHKVVFTSEGKRMLKTYYGLNDFLIILINKTSARINTPQNLSKWNKNILMLSI